MSRREELGRLVREVCTRRARERGDAKPSHLARWEEMAEEEREDDRQIGEAVAAAERLACQVRINAETDRQLKEWDAATDDEKPAYASRSWWESGMDDAAELLESEGKDIPRLPLDFPTAQSRTQEIKLAKGFGTTDVSREFCLLYGEVGEAYDAWRKGKPDYGQELADIAIFTLGLAEMTGKDLGAEVEAKLTKVAAREYHPLANGAMVKEAEPEAGA